MCSTMRLMPTVGMIIVVVVLVLMPRQRRAKRHRSKDLGFVELLVQILAM